MPRSCFRAMRTAALATGAVAAVCAAPSFAQRSRNSAFVRRMGIAIGDYPASAARFPSQQPVPSGPADVVVPVHDPANWRMCGECGYRAALPKPVAPLAFRANFQPIGGTLRYRF